MVGVAAAVHNCLTNQLQRKTVNAGKIVVPVCPWYYPQLYNSSSAVLFYARPGFYPREREANLPVDVQAAAWAGVSAVMAHPGFYLSLIVGNTRLHWAQVKDDDRGHVLQRWDTSHISAQSTEGQAAGPLLKDFLTVEVWHSLFPRPAEGEGGNTGDEGCKTWPTTVPLYLASVVPEQTRLWSLLCPHVTVVESRMCLSGLEQYPTLGVDRALSVRGASTVFGWPVLVVDGGTALTFTRGDVTAGGAMRGGAILPGIRVQFETLRGRTALLPLVSLPPLDAPLPSTRWAMSTPSAIQSGVAHGAVAVVEDFSRDFWNDEPLGTVVLTGGDAEWMYACLQERAGQGKHAGWGPGETDKDDYEEGSSSKGPCWVVNNDVAHHGLHWVVRRLGGQGDS